MSPAEYLDHITADMTAAELRGMLHFFVGFTYDRQRPWSSRDLIDIAASRACNNEERKVVEA